MVTKVSFDFRDSFYSILNLAYLDPEEEKRETEELTEKFKPLIDWLKTEAKDQVRDGTSLAQVYHLIVPDKSFTVVISNRLVTSPCAIVAESYGYTANIQKMMSES